MILKSLRDILVGAVVAIIVILMLRTCSGGNEPDVVIEYIYEIDTIRDTVIERDTIINHVNRFIYVDTQDGVLTNIDTNLVYCFDFEDTVVNITSNHYMSLRNDSIFSDSFKLDYVSSQRVEIRDRYVDINHHTTITKTERIYPTQWYVGGGAGYSFQSKTPSLLLGGGVSFKKNHINLMYDPFQNYAGVTYFRTISK